MAGKRTRLQERNINLIIKREDGHAVLLTHCTKPGKKAEQGNIPATLTITTQIQASFQQYADHHFAYLTWMLFFQLFLQLNSLGTKVLCEVTEITAGWPPPQTTGK